MLRIASLRLDHFGYFATEHAVFHHQDVRVKDCRILRADRLSDLFLHRQDLLPSRHQRILKSLELALYIRHVPAGRNIVVKIRWNVLF